MLAWLSRTSTLWALSIVLENWSFCLTDAWLSVCASYEDFNFLI